VRTEPALDSSTGSSTYTDYQWPAARSDHEWRLEMCKLADEGHRDRLGDSQDIALYAQHAYAE